MSYAMMTVLSSLSEALPRSYEAKDWVTLVLLLILGLVAFSKFAYTYNFKRFSTVLFAYHYLIDDTVEDKSPIHTVLFVANALILSLGLYYINGQIGIFEGTNLVVFFKCFLLYTVFVLGKYLIEKILGVVFSMEDLITHYVRFKLTLKNFLALMIFPVLVVLTYVNSDLSWLIWSVFWVFIALNVVYIGVFLEKIRIINTMNWYYIILYLCTFELGPYFILYKVIV